MTESGFRQGAAWVDGQIVPISEAKISILDNGFLHSDATYDVAHVWKGKFFRLEDHINRFFAGMDKLHMSIPFNQAQVQSVLMDCVRATGLREAYVEMICTRGIAKPGSRDPRDCVNQFFAFVIPFVWIADFEKQEQGLHLIITDIERISPAAVNPIVKNYHWLDMTMALFQAYEKGGETAVLVDGVGNVIEGPGFNIFAVNNKSIVTPSIGVLEGITRRTAIEIAQKMNCTVELRELHKSELLEAQEVFLTSSAGGIIPVTKINNENVNHGRPGELTQKIKTMYWNLHKEDKYNLAVDYPRSAN